MHRGAVADAGMVSLFLAGYILIWSARGKQNPKLVLAPFGCCSATHPMGRLEQAASCSFSPSSSVSLEVVEKRDEGDLFERMLVHNLRVYTAGGEVALSGTAQDRLCQVCVCQARLHRELKDQSLC